MSEEDKKVTPDFNEGEDKTSEENEKKELNPETLLYQKKAAQEKAKKESEAREKLEAELVELKSKQEVKKDNDVPQNSNNNSSALQEKIEAIEFTMNHRDLSSDAIQAALSVSKMNGISKEEALENPMVKAFIEKIEEEKKANNAVPTGNRSSVATDDEKKENEDTLRRARQSGKAEDWAKVLDKRINK